MGSGGGKILAALTGWVAGAATAVAVGLFALSAIGLQPPSQAGLPQIPAVTVGTAAASAGPATPSPPSPSATPATNAAAPGNAAVERLLTSPGGSVIARCSPAGAYLVSWSPAQGYKAEDVRRGPAATAKLSFESRGGEYEMSVQCVNGTPEAAVSRVHR